jgi:serine/threonine-protein kinase RsbW
VRFDVAVCLPLEAETVALIRTVVTDALNSLGVTQDCVDDIRLALSEACTNVIDHATADDEYEVRVEVDDRECVVSVKDAGAGFDASAVAATAPGDVSSRGRGIAIMRALMDRVDFHSEPESGTTVRLVKTLAVHEQTPLARLRAGRPSGS